MSNQPEPGKVYRLTGGPDEPSLHRGDGCPASEIVMYDALIFGASSRRWSLRLTADEAWLWGQRAIERGFSILVEPVSEA